LWVIKVWFFASTLVLKIATFAKPETVRKRKIYLITRRADIKFGFCSITVSGMEKLATVGRDDLSKS